MKKKREGKKDWDYKGLRSEREGKEGQSLSHPDNYERGNPTCLVKREGGGSIYVGRKREEKEGGFPKEEKDEYTGEEEREGSSSPLGLLKRKKRSFNWGHKNENREEEITSCERG